MLKSRSKSKIFTLVVLFLIAAIGIVVIRLGYFEPAKGTRQCPSAWYTNDGASGIGSGSEEPSSFMQVDGKPVDEKTMDISWIEKHCELNKPRIVY